MSRIPVALLAAAAALLSSCASESNAPRADDADIAQPMLTGRVVDAAGRPVADCEVRVYGGFATRWRTGGTRTAADGTFSFDEVTGAQTKPDDGDEWHQYVGVSAGETVGGLNPPSYLPWQDVTIAPGGTAHVELVLDADEVERRIAAERARRGG